MSEFKSCPVCQEQSDQCLPCGSYVVDGERIYYGKLKDFGATKDHEVRFINRIQKHHVTAFFHNGKLYIPSRQGRSVPLAIGLQWDAWQEQQAKIDKLIYKAKLRESDHRALLVKYQATKKCWEGLSVKKEELKTQLNNMKACYIEKKKELEDQHKKVDEVLEYLDGESANRWGLWKENADMLDQGASNAFKEAYWMVKKALRGAND